MNERIRTNFDRQEQYFRRNCILIYRTPELPNENTDNVVVKTITEHLEINITENDLDQSRQLGKRSTNQNKSRSITVKLGKYNI